MLHNRVDLAALVIKLGHVVDTLILLEALNVFLLRHVTELLQHLFNLLLSLELLVEIHFLDQINRIELFEMPIHVVIGQTCLVGQLELGLRSEVSLQGRLVQYNLLALPMAVILTLICQLEPGCVLFYSLHRASQPCRCKLETTVLLKSGTRLDRN